MRPGDLIDIWVVEKALGAGGMGSVYRCHNRSAKRILAAVKVLDPALRRVAGAEERFVREAEILFTLDHPNIVRVRNIRIDSEPPYLEMEFVEGEALDRLLLRGAMTWRRTHSILVQLTDALAYLHSRGVRHRDVKPANVLVRADGRICLVDFGLAMEADQSRLTESNTTFGTVSYAPPEWIDPDAMDPEKWDLYSVGVVAWEILRGQIAFPVSGKGSPRQQAMQVIIAKQNQPALDPGEEFHDDVRALIRDLTAPDPSRRPGSMADVCERVRALDPGLPVRATATLSPAPSVPPTATPTVEEPAMRTAWAKALEETPVPAEPKAVRRLSEARTLLTGPPTASARWAAWAALGLLVAVASLGAVAGLGLLGGPPVAATRALDVVVTGLAPGTEVSLLLDGEPARSRTSWVWRFGERAPGAHAARWAVGPGCATAGCPGDACPVWCGVGEATIEVVPGTGSQSAPLVLEMAAPRTVTVSVAEDRGPLVHLVRLGDLSRATPGAVATFDGVVPGPWPVEVILGACPIDARGCAAVGDCPTGCVSWVSEAAVPWGEGPWPLFADVPLPVVAPVTPAPTVGPAPVPVVRDLVREPVPEPVPEPPSAAVAGAPVTVGAYAAWLASQPEWHRDAAISGGRADQGYLPGWAGGHAPPGTEGQALRDVSWYAAAAYCKGRGGIADLASEPTAWEETPSQPYIEWRITEGRAAWRSGDGQSSTKVRMNEANSFTGFRCAR